MKTKSTLTFQELEDTSQHTDSKRKRKCERDLSGDYSTNTTSTEGIMVSSKNGNTVVDAFMKRFITGLLFVSNEKELADLQEPKVEADEMGLDESTLIIPSSQGTTVSIKIQMGESAKMK